MIPSQKVLNLAASGDPERVVPLIIEKLGTTGIDRLIGHRVAEVRAVLAKSEKLLPHHIDKLIEDKDYFVIQNLKSNPNLQRRHIDLLERIVFVDGIERVELLDPEVRIPAEWEPHACCWMAWAFHPDDWENLVQVKAELEKVIQTIAKFEPVRLLSAPEHLTDARNRFSGDKVKIIEAPVDDIWMRDIAPTFALCGREVLAIDYNFNGWGNTMERRARPGDRLAATASAIFGVPRICAPFIAEGGAFITNGARTLITTESCLLKRNRNPFGPRGIRKQRIAEQAFREFGVHRLIWLRGDPGEPITSGHIDGYALFTALVALLVEDIDDRDLKPRWRAHDITTLENEHDAFGRQFNVKRVFAPRRQYWQGNFNPRTFAPCYLNVYVANDAVIGACFGDPERDEAAKDALARAFPGRSIEMLRIDHIAAGGGGVRCLTQPMPKPDGTE
jgi:agmatine deiminase